MEIFIFILIYVGLLYVIYKFAESKNSRVYGLYLCWINIQSFNYINNFSIFKKTSRTKKKKNQKVKMVCREWLFVSFVHYPNNIFF